MHLYSAKVNPKQKIVVVSSRVYPLEKDVIKINYSGGTNLVDDRARYGYIGRN